MTRFSLALAFALLASSTATARPKLGVLVVFDQMREVEVQRYAPFFHQWGPGGFGGLDGARLTGVYPYAGTETGPGHATLATGASPRIHGIATNSWFEGTTRHYVVDDPAAPVLGSTAGTGRSPRSLLAPTLGDTMKIESGGRARVVTVSLKDRAAILTGGKSADLAIWYDPAQGRFTTSTYYASALPPWLESLGAALPAEARKSGVWSPMPAPKGLEELIPVDDRVGEGAIAGMARTFPHDLKDVPAPLAADVYRATPQALEDVFTIALAAVDAMALGADEEPDLLVVSISTTDVVGHAFGPDSLEELDTLRRADLALRKFRAALEKRLGKRELVLAVSSDHGCTPLPAAQAPLRVPGGTVVLSDVTDAAERAAQAAAPLRGPRVLGFFPPQLFVDTRDLDDAKRAKALKAAAAAVAAIPGIAHVYDVTDAHGFEDDAFGELMRASAPPGRHAPLLVRQEPRVVYMEGREVLGTDHGTPYLYDRRVPVFFAGPGVRRGVIATPVDVRDVASTLAYLLGVPPPDLAEGNVIERVIAE